MKNKIAYANLRAEMARQNLTIGSVANAIGISRWAASHKFGGHYDLTLIEAVKIAKLLKQPVEFLFEELFTKE